MLPHRCASSHGPFARYVKLRIVHALGMPGMISPPPTSKETASKRSRHASRHVHEQPVILRIWQEAHAWHVSILHSLCVPAHMLTSVPCMCVYAALTICGNLNVCLVPYRLITHKCSHNDVTRAPWHLRSPVTWVFVPFVRANIKESKVRITGQLLMKSACDWWIFLT